MLNSKKLPKNFYNIAYLPAIGDIMESAKKGDKVKVEYTGTFDNGEIFDTSEGREPLQFEIGAGQVIKGFDKAMEGMNVGEEKEIKLEPTDAYGDHNPQLLKKMPREQFPQDREIKKGMMVALRGPDGSQIPVTIAEADEKEVTLDLNHPLAGKKLNFKLKLVEITA